MSVKYSRLAASVHPPAKPDVTDRLYTAKEVAARLGVSERWVRDHATRRQPRLRAVKLGSLLRFQWADVHEFIQAQITGSDFTLRRNHASIEPFSATELRGHTGER